MKRMIRTGAMALLLLCGGARAELVEESTGFEFFDADGFTLGGQGARAFFTGGTAEILGIPMLYYDGVSAWVLAPGETGTVSFETPVASVALFFRDRTADTTSTLTIRDRTGAVLLQEAGSDAGPEIMMFTRAAAAPEPGAALVDEITFENASEAGAPTRYAVIDAMTWTVDCARVLETQVIGDDPAGVPEALLCLARFVGT